MKKDLILGIILFCGMFPAFGQREQYDNISKLVIRLDQLNVHIGHGPGSALVVTKPQSGNLTISVSGTTLTIAQTGELPGNQPLDILVPDNLTLDIRTNSGDIGIDQVKGGIDAYSSKGDISAMVSPISVSHIESERGKVNVRILAPLTADLHVAAGAGKGVLDLSGHPLNAALEMKSFYPTGTIKAPYDFKEVHITRTYGPDTILKRIELGDHHLAVSLTTGDGTLEVIP